MNWTEKNYRFVDGRLVKTIMLVYNSMMESNLRLNSFGTLHEYRYAMRFAGNLYQIWIGMIRHKTQPKKQNKSEREFRWHREFAVWSEIDEKNYKNTLFRFLLHRFFRLFSLIALLMLRISM